MVQGPSSRSLRSQRLLLLLLLAAELHAAHALRDAGHARRSGLGGAARRRIALLGTRVGAVRAGLLVLVGRLRSAIALGILEAGSSRLLGVGLRVGAVGLGKLGDGGDAELRSTASDAGVGAGAHVEGLGGIASLFLLARRGGGILLGVSGRGRLLKLLLLVTGELPVPVVWGGRHGGRRRSRRARGVAERAR